MQIRRTINTRQESTGDTRPEKAHFDGLHHAKIRLSLFVTSRDRKKREKRSKGEFLYDTGLSGYAEEGETITKKQRHFRIPNPLSHRSCSYFAARYFLRSRFARRAPALASEEPWLEPPSFGIVWRPADESAVPVCFGANSARCTFTTITAKSQPKHTATLPTV